MMEMDLPKTLDELAALMGQRLGVRGAGFAAKLRRAGRLLPKPVRQAGADLVEMERLWENPKLRRRIDAQHLAAQSAIVRRHLEGIDRADRRRAYWLGVAAPLAFNLLLLFVLIVVGLQVLVPVLP